MMIVSHGTEHLPMARIGLDPESKVVNEVFALVYAPGRRRDRFPENCITVVNSEAEALSGADSAKNLFPARVIGPSRSSEGLRLYYLVGWLDVES